MSLKENNKLQPLKIGGLTAQIPVIQGGMGVGISLSRLAGTVAACGGVGIISTAQIGFRKPTFDKDPIGTNLKAIGEEVQKARDLDKKLRSQKGLEGKGIIGVNIMVATRKYEDYVRTAVEAGTDLIISGAGLPMNLPELVKGSSTLIAPIVSSLKSAQVIMRYWHKKYNCQPDLVVIEGPKAGGHLGFSYEQLENMEVLSYNEEIIKITKYVKECAKEAQKEIPVVAAGGIYTREDANRVVSLGVDGVQMATRFVTTYECDADESYKQAYIAARKEDITLVKSPVGMPGRAINNAFLEKARCGQIPHGKCHLCLKNCKPTETPYCITEALINAATGNINNALLFCGTNAWRAQKLETVQDIMQEFTVSSEPSTNI